MARKQNLNHVDPFNQQSTVYLFPQTLPDAKAAVKSNDLEEFHQYMNSLASQVPDKHFEEAKLIVDGGSDLLNTKESDDNTKENKDPLKKRPALARRRAKFSLKPDTSQPTTIAEPSFQFDSSQDPEEFFAAYDRFENAKKEMKRQRGEDLNEDIILVTTRQRRPEIPRRKSVYQHHVYSSQPETVPSFDQEPQGNTGSQSQQTHPSQQESVTANCKSNEKEVSATVDTDKLFNELMSSNIASLDENDATSLLNDCLNIKDVDVDTLRLPDFHDIPKVFQPSSVISIKDQSILSDTRALSDSLRGIAPGNQKSSFDSSFLASPKPPRSPFLAISALGKSLSKSVESNDPYSPRDTDLHPARTSEIIGEHATHVSNEMGVPVADSADLLEQNEVTEAPVHDVLQKVSDEVPIILEDNHEGAVSGIQTDEGLQTNSEEMVQKVGSAIKQNITVEDVGDDDHFQGVQDMEENVENVKENEESLTDSEVNVEVPTIKEIQSHVQSAQTDADSANKHDASRPVQTDDNSAQKEQLRTSVVKRKKSIPKRKVNKNKRRQAAQTDVDSANERDASIPAQNSDIVPEQHNEEQLRTSMDKRKKSIPKRKVDKKKRPQIPSAQTEDDSANERDASIPAQDSDIIPEEHNEEQLRTSVDKRKKSIAKREDKKKRRQSLAGAGSNWTTGIRRSSRIRTKPLEYWNGERVLYARVHNSLPTVIGVKYLDPTTDKDGKKPSFKVESYVSDQYKELVELTALH
ncbi:centromere protein C [Rutidosis leptorrhynchoides]|uniref:centromere protein C n=1 Tax=Rutidosis leptorrhynchoides TaxID=125765 RepID=UPI003A9A0D97